MGGRGSTLVGTTAWRPPCDHGVTFYESDDFLVGSTAAFLASALRAGRPAIAVATPAHLEAIEAALAVRAAHPAGGWDDGQLVTLDAHEALDRLMVDGMPDPAVFDAVIGELIGVGAQAGSDPSIFGEMVAVLWNEGNVTGALALEDLWNDLARSRSFLLSCAYPLRAFESDGDAAAFREVCRKHSSVTPGESYSRLRDPDEQQRHVAVLQQEATAGTREREALRRGQEELEAALERLAEADRLRNEFVAMVAHDLRGPAAVISGSLDLLADASSISAEQTRTLLTGAAESARSIRRLADDVLTLSRLEARGFDFELRPLDPADVVARAVREVRATTGHPIEVEQPPRRPMVLVDAERQVQILTNLLTNAVKSSSPTSPVRVCIEDRGREVGISVVDRGVGIRSEDRSELFRPFARVAGQPAGHRGSGLGLAIARALVEGQGGTIRLESQPGRGTTVSYTVLVAPGRG
jgi:signal transduction histidine kinase